MTEQTQAGGKDYLLDLLDLDDPYKQPEKRAVAEEDNDVQPSAKKVHFAEADGDEEEKKDEEHADIGDIVAEDIYENKEEEELEEMLQQDEETELQKASKAHPGKTLMELFSDSLCGGAGKPLPACESKKALRIREYVLVFTIYTDAYTLPEKTEPCSVHTGIYSNLKLAYDAMDLCRLYLIAKVAGSLKYVWKTEVFCQPFADLLTDGADLLASMQRDDNRDVHEHRLQQEFARKMMADQQAIESGAIDKLFDILNEGQYIDKKCKIELVSRFVDDMFFFPNWMGWTMIKNLYALPTDKRVTEADMDKLNPPPRRVFMEEPEEEPKGAGRPDYNTPECICFRKQGWPTCDYHQQLQDSEEARANYKKANEKKSDDVKKE